MLMPPLSIRRAESAAVSSSEPAKVDRGVRGTVRTIRTRLLRITGLDEHLIGTSAGARRLGRLNWHKCGARQRSGIKWHKWSPRPKSYFPPVHLSPLGWVARCKGLPMPACIGSLSVLPPYGLLYRLQAVNPQLQLGAPTQ